MKLSFTVSKRHLTCITMANIISIIIYVISTICLNKSHNNFILKNLQLLSKYGLISSNLFIIYTLIVFAITLYCFCIKLENKLHNFILLNIGLLLNFCICFIIDFSLNKVFFKPMSSFIKYLNILINTDLTFLILYVFNKIKDRPIKMLKTPR